MGVPAKGSSSKMVRGKGKGGISQRARNGQQSQAVSQWYYDTFSAVELLTAEEEVELSNQCRAGDALEASRAALEERLQRAPTHEEWAEEVGTDAAELRRQLARASRATDHMVAANMRLIVSIARSFWPQSCASGGSLSMEDLVQEGSLGFLKAVRAFDPERGNRFSTLATWWIRASIQRGIADKARTIRLPNSKFRLLAAAKATYAELRHRNGKPPDEAELAAELRVSLAQLRGVLRHSSSPYSLETPLRADSTKSADNTKTLLDTHSVRPMGKVLPLVEKVEMSLMGETIERQLDETLAPLEARVLRLRYGLEDGDCLSWASISERCGRPVRELQTVQARALRRLRKQPDLRGLQELFCHHAAWETDPLQ